MARRRAGRADTADLRTLRRSANGRLVPLVEPAVSNRALMIAAESWAAVVRITKGCSSSKFSQFKLGFKQPGACPVNIKFLIEGEEEIGSPNLAALLEQKKDRLRCDLVVVFRHGNMEARHSRGLARHARHTPGWN